MSYTEWGLASAGIALLVAIARWLKLAESRIDDTAAARRFAERALPGFVAGSALVVPTGAAALVAGEGAIALLTRRGARVEAHRLLPPLAAREVPEGSVIFAGERIVLPVALHGVTLDQVRALEAEAAVAYRTLQ